RICAKSRMTRRLDGIRLRPYITTPTTRTSAARFAMQPGQGESTAGRGQVARRRFGDDRPQAAGSALASARPRTSSRCWARDVLGAAAPRQPPQEAQLAIEQHARLRAVDLPAPRICQIEGAANLPGAAVRHVPEPPGIAAMAATAFGKVEHDAARRALD